MPNFKIPPLGRSIRITDLKGNPICIGRRHVRRGRFRLCYKKSTFEQQRTHAFALLDHCFSILDQVGTNRLLKLMHNFKHAKNYRQPQNRQPISTPTLTIEVRHKDDFQAGNFSRFPDIWLILIGM